MGSGSGKNGYGLESTFTILSKRWKWIHDYYIPLSLYAWQVKAYPTAKANTTAYERACESACSGAACRLDSLNS